MYGKQAQPTHSLADAQKFIAELNEEAKHHRAIHHPYLQKLICGDLPDPKASLKDFFFQYLAYSVDFMRYLMATMSQLDDRKYREKLMGNLMEESGRVDPEDASKLAEIGVQLEWVQGVPHPDQLLGGVPLHVLRRQPVAVRDEGALTSGASAPVPGHYVSRR